MIVQSLAMGGTIYASIAFNQRSRRTRLIDVLCPDPPASPDVKAITANNQVNLVVAAASFGFSLVGYFGYPVLTVIGLVGQGYLAAYFIDVAATELTTERAVKVSVIDSINRTASPLAGRGVLNAAFATLFFWARDIVAQTRDTSKTTITHIFGEASQYVWLQTGDTEVQVAIDTVQVGDVIAVHAGEIIPLDGRVIRGFASVDQRMLTGEARPVEKEIDSAVFAGTVILSGKLLVCIEKSGSETMAAQLSHILSQTADYRSHVELQGEVWANQSTLPMLAISAVTLLTMGPLSALGILFAYPGYDVRVTTPVSVLNYLQIALQENILIKDGRAFERLSQVDTVVFDKTGTLTQEQPQVGYIHTYAGYSEAQVLQYAAAAEYKQTHPIASAILYEAQHRHLDLPPIDETTYEIGYGLRVRLNGRLVRVGSARFMALENIAIPPAMAMDEAHQQGYSLVYVAVENRLVGAIELRPTLRPEVKQVVEVLKQRHLTLYVISGDHAQPTQRLAQELGIDAYYAEVLPEQKAALIEELQQAGKTVCFVGDGINDSIALKQADASVSLRGAATIATDTAQVILLDGSLERLVQMFELSSGLRNTIRVNLGLAMVAPTVAIVGTYFIGLGLTPIMVVSDSFILIGLASSMWPKFRHKLASGEWTLAWQRPRPTAKPALTAS